MKRKFLSFLLVLSMILTFMPAMAFAYEDPEPAKISISADNAQSVLDPVEPVEFPFGSDAVADVTIKASRLVRTNNQNIRFKVKAETAGSWDGAVVTGKQGQTGWGSFNTGDEINLDINVNSLKTKSEYEYDFALETGEGTVNGKFTIKLDFTETDVFRNRTNGDPQYGDAYFANSQYLIKWSNGTDEEFLTDQDAWKDMKAKKAAAKFMDEYNAAVKAKEDADASKAAAEEAMKTPGDAAVEAAQKALDDAKKAEQAAKDLENALGNLENIDELYIDNAGDPYAADLADAKKIASAENYAALEKAIGEAESKLAQAKAENAEKKAAEDKAAADADKAAAEDAAKKAAADKAAAEKAAADAAVLAYTPAKTKVTGVKSSKKKATVSFNKVPKNVTGYQIAVTNKKTGEVKIVYAKKSSKKTIKKTVKGLKKNTKYSVKVRAYNTVGTMTYCAPWSKAKSFKTKK